MASHRKIQFQESTLHGNRLSRQTVTRCTNANRHGGLVHGDYFQQRSLERGGRFLGYTQAGASWVTRGLLVALLSSFPERMLILLTEENRQGAFSAAVSLFRLTVAAF